MPRIFMQLSSSLVGAFALMMVLAHAQDQSDFISIDCGLQQSTPYTQDQTSIEYTPETDFIDPGVGVGKAASRDIFPERLLQQLWYLREFPDGKRNCYKIKIKSGQKYLVRAGFVYGDYDGLNRLPKFDLHIGTNFWESVVFTKVTQHIIKELIHVPMINYIHICLVNVGKGAPFISTIELRPLPNDAYQTEAGTSLALVWNRWNMAMNATIYRFPNDVKDRIWYPYIADSWTELIAPLPIDQPDEIDYELPSDVMRTAATPALNTSYLNITWVPGAINKNATYYIYMHFAEIESVKTDRSRVLTVGINGERIAEPFSPVYLRTTTKNITISADIGKYNFSIYSPDMVYKSILNAYEIYVAKEFLEPETNQQDVEAITHLKSTYEIKRNWYGDPCYPKDYMWKGVNCSYSGGDSARIVSLNLSSSGLIGDIAGSIENLTMLEVLDLSDNKLSGHILEFLSQLTKLKTLKLEENDLTGSVPPGLAKGKLLLSLCGDPNFAKQLKCEKKERNQFVIPVVVSVIAALLILSIAATILLLKGYNMRDAWRHRRLTKQGSCVVFLSFRGQDTRKGFTSNLYQALCKKGIQTFFDDVELETGSEIRPALVTAIEDAKISVIVLSKNYTSSCWCLDELVKILDCKKTRNQYVYPVFYEVLPSNVRYQSDTYTLDGQKKHNEEKIPGWEEALKEIADLSGLTYPDGRYRNEAEAIQDIVQKIYKKIKGKRRCWGLIRCVTDRA